MTWPVSRRTFHFHWQVLSRSKYFYFLFSKLNQRPFVCLTNCSTFPHQGKGLNVSWRSFVLRMVKLRFRVKLLLTWIFLLLFPSHGGLGSLTGPVELLLPTVSNCPALLVVRIVRAPLGKQAEERSLSSWDILSVPPAQSLTHNRCLLAAQNPNRLGQNQLRPACWISSWNVNTRMM